MNFNPDFLSKGYNLNTNHPIQPSSQEYIINDKKYVSIHSEDRDMIKYPNPSNFEIEMPQDILNVSTVRLVDWTFPANYDVFSAKYNNLSFTFNITKPYNPGEFNYSNQIAEIIYKCLFLTQNEPYVIAIQEGFYNPTQMTTELTNKMNAIVTQRIYDYINTNYTDVNEKQNILDHFSGYDRFVVVYNIVSQKIWFGNKADGFILTNTSQFIKSQLFESFDCISNVLPNFSNWGLPSNLGLPRVDVVAISQPNFTPRFFYGDVVYGDNGYWLLAIPELIGSQVYFIESPNKINLMGEAFFYIEIQGLNNIDETSPYNLSDFTQSTNQTNGIVNSAFAKISIPTTPIGQWFDKEGLPYKLFLPPAERIRRLKIKIRYHDGKLVDFNVFPYSFTLEFTLVNPQILRTGNYVAKDSPLLNKYYSLK